MKFLLIINFGYFYDISFIKVSICETGLFCSYIFSIITFIKSGNDYFWLYSSAKLIITL